MPLQDASTASLVWVLTLMAEHPEVLERVRAEQAAARPDLNATVTAETLTQMPYTRQVCHALLRKGLAQQGCSTPCMYKVYWSVDICALPALHCRCRYAGVDQSVQAQHLQHCASLC